MGNYIWDNEERWIRYNGEYGKRYEAIGNGLLKIRYVRCGIENE